MSLIVYGVPLSPFVRKLRLAEKGLDYQLEIVLPFDQPDWFRELNPLGRIPAIKDGDLALADSSVICQYIEDKHGDLPHCSGKMPKNTPRCGGWMSGAGRISQPFLAHQGTPVGSGCITKRAKNTVFNEIVA